MNIFYIAGDTIDKQIADTLIEDDLRWDTRIKSRQNRCVRRLIDAGLFDLFCEILAKRLAGNESFVACYQCRQGIVGSDKFLLINFVSRHVDAGKNRN